MSQTKVLAFDIGIKNLAFCLMEGTTIHKLENVNILPSVEKITCSNCSAAASFTAGSQNVCKRHIPKTFTVINSPQKVTELKALAKSNGIDIKKKTKEDLLRALSETHAFPYAQPKKPKASTQSLEQLHDALRRFITEYWSDFSQASTVLLENQPAFKNPHMKSVQVLLFTALRERFLQHNLTTTPASTPLPPPKFHLVHAKKKVSDAEAGDAGYAERKSKSEQRIQELLNSSVITPVSPTVLAHWTSAKKKSDMADAACMCYDFLLSLPK